MDIFDILLCEISVKVEPQMRRVRDIIADLPMFDNTTRRLKRAKNRAKVDEIFGRN